MSEWFCRRIDGRSLGGFMQKWLLCCLVLGCVGCGEEPVQQRQTKASAAVPQATVALYEQGVAAEHVGDAS